ncbi:hypothetical protein E4U42_004098 [Claviceps africana]|uniref:DNL-type domain-containing protein n=1 Tax=Claviceps africana TaxID=83212 RepID=A0A8K0NIH1_9HYPO|nr:hypothetical protein E4U42_004098 [Claviceps africana]
MASKAPSLSRSLLLHHPLRRAASSSPQQLLRATKATPSLPIAARRAAHSIPRPPPRKTPIRLKPEAEARARAASSEKALSEGARPPANPAYYQLSFTCVPCGHRSHHNVSKQGYHKGSTLITCPGCRNRHVISDHLNIFGDRKITVEDLMRERGRLVKRGSLGEDGDIEFWPEEEGGEQADGSREK